MFQSYLGEIIYPIWKFIADYVRGLAYIVGYIVAATTGVCDVWVHQILQT